MKTEVAGSRIKNGGLQNTLSGYTVGTEGLQEKIGDLKDMNITWDAAKELATDRAERRQRVTVAQCTHLGAG